jgi:hypothetical protein
MIRVLSAGVVLIAALLLASCATSYQPEGFTGGYSDFLTGPDEATITFRGNAYTDPLRLGEMAALHCADVTLQHGFRYFIITGFANASLTTTITTPGHAYTFGSAYGTSVGGFTNVYGSANTVYAPPTTRTFLKPGIIVRIRMGNDRTALERFGVWIPILGRKSEPKDAAFLSKSLRQHLGVKS